MADQEKEGPEGETPQQGFRDRIKEGFQKVEAVFKAARIGTLLMSWPVVLIVLLVALGALLVGLSLFAVACSGFFGKACKNDVAEGDPIVEEVKAHLQTEKPVRLWDDSKKQYALDRRKEACLKFDNDLDKRFLTNPGVAIKNKVLGFTTTQKIYPDRRLMESIKYLCERHRHLRISHVISAYIDMEIDPESGSYRNAQIISNVSAHKDGQALDITEVDYAKCGIGPFAKTYPVEVKKQDPPPPRKGAGAGSGLPNLPIPGTNLGDVSGILEKELGLPPGSLSGNPQQTAMNTLLRSLEQEMGLSPGTLGVNGSFAAGLIGFDQLQRDLGIAQGKDWNDSLTETAKRQLEQQWGLPPGTLKTLSTNSILQSLALRELEKQWGLPAGTLSLGNNTGNLDMIARFKIEQALNLPPGTLSGKSLPEIRDAVILSLAEQGLGLPPGTLKTGDLSGILESLDGGKIEAIFGLPFGTGAAILSAIKSGNLSDALNTLGSNILGWKLGVDAGKLLDALQGKISLVEALQGSRAAQALFDQFGLSLAQVSNILSGKGSLNDFLSIGAAQLGAILGVNHQDLLAAAQGTKSWGEVLGSSQFIKQLEESWRLPPGTIANLLSGQLGNAGQSASDWGGRLLDSYLGLAPGSLAKVLSGEESLLDILSQSKFVTELAAKYGIPLSTLADFLTGKGSPQNVGWQILGTALGVSKTTIEEVLAGKKSVTDALKESTYIKKLEEQLKLPPGTVAAIFNPANLANKSEALVNVGLNLINQYLGLEPYDPNDPNKDRRFSIQNILNGKRGALEILPASFLFQKVEGQLGLPHGALAALFDSKTSVDWRQKIENIGARMLEQKLGLPVDDFLKVLHGEKPLYDVLLASSFLSSVAAKYGISLPNVAVAISGEIKGPDGKLRAATPAERTEAFKEAAAGIVGNMLDQTLGLHPGTSKEAIKAALSGDYSRVVDLAGGVIDKQFGLPAGTMKEVYRATQTGDWSKVERVGIGFLEQKMGIPSGTLAAVKEGLTTGNWAGFGNLGVGFVLSKLDQSLGLPSGSSYGLYLLLTTGNPAGLVAVAIGALIGGFFGSSESCLQNAGRANVNKVVKELLEFPEERNDIDLRITQLIIFSRERDVVPFEKDGTLDRIYGKDRPANYGVFAMPEAWDHVHIGY